MVNMKVNTPTMVIVVLTCILLLPTAIGSQESNNGVNLKRQPKQVVMDEDKDLVYYEKPANDFSLNGVAFDASDRSVLSSPTSPPVEDSSKSSGSFLLSPGARCSCQSCDDAAWSAIAGGHTCGERISFLLGTDPNFFPTEKAACARVAAIEYPSQCGACDPATCDGRIPPTTTKLSNCGCNGCTETVWKSLVDDLSCEAHVTWTQLSVPEKNTEEAACQFVSEKFPLSPCGQQCNPTTCSKSTQSDQDAITCGCPNCTPEILSKVADSFTCGERINFLRATSSESEACAVVAGSEFPTICGPQCDPARCNDTPTSTAIVTPIVAPTPAIVSSPTLAPVEPTSTFIADTDGFGDNVIIFDPTMSTASIQEIFDGVYAKQVNNEMGQERYSMYFLPGVYGTIEQPLTVLIGYYTEVAGVGGSPLDVVINGKIEVYNRCFEADPYNAGKFIPTSAEQGKHIVNGGALKVFCLPKV
jgi:hypothetical protein